MLFGEKLYQLRKENNLSQEQLAEKCNVSRQAVSKWESGQGYPEMEKVLQLCDILKVDLDYLMRDNTSRSENTNTKENSITKDNNIIFKSFIGKWVKIFLDDKEFKGLYKVGIVAMNKEFIIFEDKAKKGVIKISDIKSMSSEDISKLKYDKIKSIATREISDEYIPYKEFQGITCNIRLKCSSLFTTPQGYYHAKVFSVTEGGIIIEQKGKEIAIKTSDILMIMEV